jgi:hypothetical protein
MSTDFAGPLAPAHAFHELSCLALAHERASEARGREGPVECQAATWRELRTNYRLYLGQEAAGAADIAQAALLRFGHNRRHHLPKTLQVAIVRGILPACHSVVLAERDEQYEKLRNSVI